MGQSLRVVVVVVGVGGAFPKIRGCWTKAIAESD